MIMTKKDLDERILLERLIDVLGAITNIPHRKEAAIKMLQRELQRQGYKEKHWF